MKVNHNIQYQEYKQQYLARKKRERNPQKNRKKVEVFQQLRQHLSISEHKTETEASKNPLTNPDSNEESYQLPSAKADRQHPEDLNLALLRKRTSGGGNKVAIDLRTMSSESQTSFTPIPESEEELRSPGSPQNVRISTR